MIEMENGTTSVGVGGLFNNTFWWKPDSPFDDPLLRSLFIVLYIAVFAICVIGNLLVVLVIMCHRKTRNNVNFFLANLSTADLCVGIFCVIPRLNLFLTPHWYLGRVMCKLLCFVQTASYACSILILTIISLERYLAISHPLETRRYTQRRLLRASIVSCVWGASAAYAAPLLFVYDIVPGDPDELFCLKVQTVLNVTTFYVMVDFILLYALPLVLMSGVYVKIAIVLWRSSSKPMQKHIYRVSGTRNRGPEAPAATAGWSFRRSRTSRGGSLRAPTWMLASGMDVNEVARVQKSMLTDATGRDREKMDEQERCNAGPDQVAATKVDVETRSGRGDARRSCCMPTNSSSSSSNNYGQMTRLESIGEDMDVTETNYVSSISNGIRMSEMPTTKGIAAAAASGSQSSKTTIQLNKNPLAHRRKVIRLLMAMVGSFAVCMLPHHVRLQWQEWSRSEEFDYRHMYLPPITTLIFFFNSALNPFLYALISDRFRQSVIEVDWFMIRRMREMLRKRR